MGGRKEGKEREGEEPGRKRRIAWAKKHTRNPIYFSFLFSWLVCFWQEAQCSSSKPDFLLKLRSSSPESPYPLCLFYIRSHARTQTHTHTMHARKVVDWEFNFLFFFLSRRHSEARNSDGFLGEKHWHKRSNKEMKEFWERRKKIVEEWTVITTPGLVMKIQNKIRAPLVISISALKQTGLETARAILFLLSVFATRRSSFIKPTSSCITVVGSWLRKKKKFFNRSSHFMSSYQQKGKNRQE